MSRFDQDTSVMRERRENTLIELLQPELPPLSKARGIISGVPVGALLWVAIVALGAVIWRHFSG